uniref:MIP34607p1 n=1 Tax=Drosophila melanogaster TaxID=7227 RepID=H1UUJ9_DROME|nr:MIP34607p1 [Drosophila melanogaster]
MKLFCNKLRQIYASRRQDRGFEMGEQTKAKTEQHEAKRNETKPTNKQTMKRKTTASKSEKRRVFLHRNLSKALCNKVKNPAAPFPHLQIPPTPLTGLTASALHLYTS